METCLMCTESAKMGEIGEGKGAWRRLDDV